ncbi:flagellar basal-body MS-ring/collar protein FliF [Oceanibium sediminis]|uniref:flagellar basal-body MS-ring/collar protein FliF n=1 Tax=Oceanibium sediminis TaxID=2026339 RepID=UPI000DD497DE|nr:flagellar basal-body MS-ring/collar protein FliF [Oceanibium sediminis]
MSQITATWTALDGRRKVILLVAVAAALLSMGAIWRLAATPNMALLYAGLDAAAAGDVITALEQQNIAYEVRGTAIYVPADARDGTRLALAADGLPASGGIGYELLDGMSGFGTTAQMFDAAYWRAKEGELARTILAGRDVRSARVHIATPARQPFARDQPVTASVTVTPAGASISPGKAEAIRHLVSSAVPGLEISAVAVIDSVNGVVLSGPEAGESPTAQPDSRAEQMKADLERLLAARVGPGKARVQVNIDADMDSQRITERVIDPASRVAISSDLEEITETEQGGGAGAVTVASNLPAGDAEGGAAQSSANRSETRERQNFEVSETTRERVIQPGQIRRITVAVMVDGLTTAAPDGSREWAPRPEEELTALRELVETAIGFDPARGDKVTLQSMEFPQPAMNGTAAEGGAMPISGGSLISLVQTTVLAVVVLLLGLFVIRPLLMRPPLPEPEILAGSLDLSVEPDPRDTEPTGGALDNPDRHKIRNLRELIAERREESADVLRRWIEAPEQTEGSR